MTYVLDTNIIIRYLRDDIIVKQNIGVAILENHGLIILRAVDYEVCRGFCCSPAPKKNKNYNDFVYNDYCDIVEVCPHTWKKAEEVYAELYNKGFTIGEIDIIIAAFCLLYDYTLVTNNTKDFENIYGLKLADWTK